jgi:hypothetical protein
MTDKTLKEFLKKHNACKDGYEFAKDLTLEQFLNTCERGDWILWLFKRTNPDDLQLLTLAKGHCANTVRHLMKDERSLKAVDTAIAFGEGKATKKDLNAADAAADAYAADAADAYAAAAAAAADADAADAAAAAAAYAADAYAADAAAAAAADAADAAAAYAADAYAAARKVNKKLTADICRRYLPIKLWGRCDR